MNLKTNPISVTSEQLDQAIRVIARQRNVAGRVSKLKEFEGVKCFKEALNLAYNPYIRFGVQVTAAVNAQLLKHVDFNNKAPLDIDSEEIWELLDFLSTSTLSSASKIVMLERMFARVDNATAHILLGILGKSLISGVAVSTVNKAWPDFIPVFSVQLANKYTDRKVKGFPLYVEPKYDGMRAAAVCHPTGEVEFLTRSGRPIPAAKLFHDEVTRLASSYRDEVVAHGLPYTGVVFDGEVLGETFNDTVSVFRKDKPAESGTFQIFDAVPMEAVAKADFVSDTYVARRGLLSRVMAKVTLANCTMSPSYQVNSKTEIWDIYKRSRELGLEGIIVKTASGTWQRKRSNDWLKVKAEETLDLTIIGAFEGEGEMEGTLGGIIVDFKGTNVRVGSGFLRKERDLLWEQFLSDLVVSEQGGGDFEVIGHTAEVQFQEITPAGSLRHPVFVRLRKDKDEVTF